MIGLDVFPVTFSHPSRVLGRDVVCSARYLRIREEMQLGAENEAALAGGSNSEAIGKLIANARRYGFSAVDGAELSFEAVADRFGFADAFDLLLRWPRLADRLDDGLKKVSASPAPSAPESSASPAAAAGA